MSDEMKLLTALCDALGFDVVITEKLVPKFIGNYEGEDLFGRAIENSYELKPKKERAIEQT